VPRYHIFFFIFSSENDDALMMLLVGAGVVLDSVVRVAALLDGQLYSREMRTFLGLSFFISILRFETLQRA
jgi:hypothetical protein